MNTAPSDAASEVSNQSSQQGMSGHSFQFRHFKALIVIILLLVVIPAAVFVLNANKSGTVAKDFTLVESSPTDQTNNFSPVGQPTFVFSRPLGISESQLSSYFTITPKVSGSWHIEKNKQVVYFSSDKTQTNDFPAVLNYNTVYTVTINHTLKANNSRSLKKDVTIAFRTKQTPSFNLSLTEKLIETQPNTPVSVSVRTGSYYDSQIPQSMTDGSIVSVGVYTASEEQLLRYFQYKENNFPLYQFSYTSANKQVKQLQATIVSDTDTFGGEQKIELPEDTFSGPGLYFLTVANTIGHDDFFVAVSNHINQVFFDTEQSSVWTTDTAGKSIGGIQATFYKDDTSPNVVDKITTDGNGLGTTKHGNKAVDFVITRRGADTAVSFTTYYGPFYNRPYGDTNRYSVFSYSDRPVYRPGDTLHYKAIVRKDDKGSYTIPKETFYLKTVYDYTLDFGDSSYKPIQSTDDGSITTDIPIPQMVLGQNPMIYLATKGSDGKYVTIDSMGISVTSYRKPDMDITVSAGEKEYISSDSAHMTVTAKTNYGQPLTNVPFSYRVLGTDYDEMKDRSTEQIDSYISGWYGTGNELATGTGTLDGKGVAHITFSTALPDSLEKSQIVTIEITPNIGAVPSIGKIAKLIHRGRFAIFFGDITSDPNNGISGSLTVFDHNSPRRPIEKQSVKISLYKTIDYNNTEFLQDQTATSSADGSVHFAFSKKDTGSYEIVAVGKDARGNTVTARTNAYIGEHTYYPSQEQYTLTANTQKNTYDVGETAEVSVQATYPVSDAVVVLTQNGRSTPRIVSTTRKSINATTWSFPVPVKKDDGNGIGVEIYSVYNGKVIVSHTSIPVTQTQKELKTAISFDKQFYHPGDTVKATLTTTDQQGKPVSADNSLSVMDAALLQIGLVSSNIFERFYSSQLYIPAVDHYDSTQGIMTNLGGGGGGCFLNGTQILMADGTLKPIENVRIGDIILTRSSDANGKLIPDRVTNTYQHAVTDYMTINNRLHVTWVHRIFLNNAWHEAKDAKVGDTLLDDAGNRILITSVSYQSGQFFVYNLTTEKTHTFFADGIYVHNDKGAGARQNFVDTAYWNPHIHTNDQGKATVSFPLPDNLTTFTAQVFSQTSDNGFGESVNSFISQKDISILPALANFYYTGDKSTISALVQNATSDDAHFTATLSIPEMNYKKSQPITVGKHDFSVMEFPVSLTTEKNELSFTIQVTDEKGTVRDSVLLKKPILPKGNIFSTWKTFTGAKDVTMQATYPSLDFNTVFISVAPNIASRLFEDGIYLSSGTSSSTGKDLFAFSYILARTRDGGISPTAYQYAKLKNDFRDMVSSTLAGRTQGGYWQPTQISPTNESLAVINLWLAKGFEEANTVHMLAGISNVPSIISQAKAFPQTVNNFVPSSQPFFSPNMPPSPPPPLPPIDISLPPPPASFPAAFEAPVASPSVQGAKTKRVLAAEPTLPPQPFEKLTSPNFQQPVTREESFIREWVLHETLADVSYFKTPESRAIDALAGVSAAMSDLKTLAIPSATDRMIWDSDTEEGRILPVIAMVEKGSLTDADRAIKGISVTASSGPTDPLALYAGVKYAERRHIYLDSSEVTVTANDVPIIQLKKDQMYNYTGTQTVPLKNASGGKVTLSVKTTSDTPVYTTYVQTDYRTDVIQEKNSSFITNLFNILSQNTDASFKPKMMDLHLTHVFRNSENGGVIPSISKGEIGIVEFSGDNPFLSFTHPQGYYDTEHTLLTTDALSPAYLYLNQSAFYDPKNQSFLDKIFPRTSNENSPVSNLAYVSPNDYSDVAVFYNSAFNYQLDKFILPYVAYGVMSGTYYKPKTTVVFPYLGIISQEK